MSVVRHRHVPVVVVGAGPAGLRAARELAPRVDGEVLVLEREREAGGVPRHSDHPGYGMRDLGRILSGPAYARRLVTGAERAGARLTTGAMVTGWADENTVEVTSPHGRETISADGIVLATGARERARAARWLPGDRPAGIFTTGELQQLVHVEHLPVGATSVGSRAVVVGAELVSWSAVLTLRQAGVRTVTLVSRHPRPEAYAAFTYPGRALFRTAVRTSTRVVAVHGRERVSGVEVEHAETGARETIACDTVIFTGDWIPDHELARVGGLDIDPGTLGPRVDSALRTDRPGVFAAGNLVHPVDTADVAALGGAHVARAVLEHLRGGVGGGRGGGGGASPSRPRAPGIRLIAEAPLRWVSPSLLRPGDPAPSRGKLLLWTDTLRMRPVVRATQDGRDVGEVRTPWPAAPGRVYRVPYAFLRELRPGGGEVRISVG